MNWTDTLVGFMRAHEVELALALAALVLFLLVSNLCLFFKLGKLPRYSKSAKAGDGPVLGDVGESARRLDRSEEEIVLLGEHQKVLEERAGRAVQKVGLVRFDAFPDVGGEQSFALALLDRDLSGVVMSNLCSRSDCRIYAKEVMGGTSPHALSDEEQEAIRRAGSL